MEKPVAWYNKDGLAGQDRYRIVRPLGSGGYADVFEALAEGEHGFQRRVALKRLRLEEAEDPDTLSSFIDEARLAGQLHHANIVGVLDFGVVDGMPFQVLELVDGLDAERLIARTWGAGRPIPEEVALDVTSAIARALAYAHEAKGPDGRPLELVHRDVKPSNILISIAGDTKLTDFGIARAAMRSSKTRAGMARGSLGYMAPEQMLGGQVDARTDVFALGCVLHALLTGVTPLADEAARARFLRDGRVDLSSSLSEVMKALLGPALAMDKRDRTPSANVFQAAIGRALAERKGVDPRARLAELVSSLCTPAAPKGAAGLFDLELLLGSDPQVRRFASVATASPKPGPDVLPTVIRPSPAPTEEATAVAERWSRARSAITDPGVPSEEKLAGFNADEPTPLLSVTPLLPVTPTPTATIPIQITVEPRPRSRRTLSMLSLLAIALGLGIGVKLVARPVEVPVLPPPPVVASPELDVAPAVPRVEPRPTEEDAIEIQNGKGAEAAAKRIRSRRGTPSPAPESTVEASTPVDPLPRALTQVASLLEAATGRVPADKLRRYEDRYFDLAEQEARVSDRALRRALADEAALLLAEVDAAQGP